MSDLHSILRGIEKGADGKPLKRTMPVRAKPRLSKLRNDLDPQAFDTLIENHGSEFLWERAQLCPCSSDETSGQPNVACPVCFGEGYEYIAPQVVKVWNRGKSISNDTQGDFGIHQMGTVKATVKAIHRPNFRDRFTNLFTFSTFQEKRRRRGPVDQLRFPIATLSEDLLSISSNGNEGAEKTYSTGVLSMRLMDPATRQPGRVLREGIDFEVVSGRIDWSLGDARGTAPQQASAYKYGEGDLYAVTYYYNPAYLVTDLEIMGRDFEVKEKSPAVQLKRFPVNFTMALDIETRQFSGGGDG